MLLKIILKSKLHSGDFNSKFEEGMLCIATNIGEMCFKLQIT